MGLNISATCVLFLFSENFYSEEVTIMRVKGVLALCLCLLPGGVWGTFSIPDIFSQCPNYQTTDAFNDEFVRNTVNCAGFRALQEKDEKGLGHDKIKA